MLINVKEMRTAFEEWYTTNAFDYERNPIGSRECDLQWRAWRAAYFHLSLTTSTVVISDDALFALFHGDEEEREIHFENEAQGRLHLVVDTDGLTQGMKE